MNNDKKAILVISFGTSHRETREKTIEAIEADIRNAFSEYEFRRAFTSPTIIRMMQSREGIQVDNLEQALERLLQDGYRHVVAQPTHVIHGFEYDRMAEVIDQCREKFEVLSFGEPLFDTEEDYRQAAQVLGDELAEYRKPGTEIVLIGHGTDHEAHATYERFAKVLEAEGMKDFSVKTVERAEDVSSQVEVGHAMQLKMAQQKPGQQNTEYLPEQSITSSSSPSSS